VLDQLLPLDGVAEEPAASSTVARRSSPTRGGQRGSSHRHVGSRSNGRSYAMALILPVPPNARWPPRGPHTGHTLRPEVARRRRSRCVRPQIVAQTIGGWCGSQADNAGSIPVTRSNRPGRRSKQRRPGTANAVGPEAVVAMTISDHQRHPGWQAPAAADVGRGALPSPISRAAIDRRLEPPPSGRRRSPRACSERSA
jgi:hypothetical protein